MKEVWRGISYPAVPDEEDRLAHALEKEQWVVPVAGRAVEAVVSGQRGVYLEPARAHHPHRRNEHVAVVRPVHQVRGHPVPG
jgi:hypothetical protein